MKAETITSARLALVNVKPGSGKQILSFFKAELERNGKGEHGLLAGLVVVVSLLNFSKVDSSLSSTVTDKCDILR